MKTVYRWRYLLPVLILWLAFGLRLYRIDSQSIWWDEGHSIFVASHSIPEIPTLPAMDVHPPAYFTALHLWMGVTGTSEFTLRYLSVIFSLLTVTLFWRFGRLLSNRWPASTSILASLAATLSPMYVAYAQEVRSYAMITFLALASTFFLWQLLFPGRSDKTANEPKKLLLLYIIVTAACLYTHYFTIFLLLFQNLAWLVWVWQNGKQSARLPRLGGIWLASQVGIGLLFAPQLLLALRQITSYTNPNLSAPSLADFISRSWQAYTVGLTIDPTPAQWGMVAVGGVILVGLLIHIWSDPFRQGVRFGFLLAWLLVPLIAYFLVLQRQPSFEPRYMMLITPALFLLLALGLTQPAKLKYRSSRNTQHATSSLRAGARVRHPQDKPAYWSHRFTLYILSLVPLVVFINGLHSYYTDETYFKDDSASVANWLADETTANDIVYIDVPHPFHYYQSQIPAPTRYLFVDIHTAADILTREAAGRERLFWVTWHGSDTDPRGVIPFLAEKYGRQLGQLDFRGYQVTWFSLPGADTTFSLPTTLTPIEATFGDVLRLDGFAYGGSSPQSELATAGEPVWATLHFMLLRQTDVDYRVSLRLRDQAGQLASQIDQDLLNDRHFRTSAWPLADPALNQAINVYTLPIAPDVSPGSYQLEVVVYNAAPPYPSEGVTGHQNADGIAAIIGRITVAP